MRIEVKDFLALTHSPNHIANAIHINFIEAKMNHFLFYKLHNRPFLVGVTGDTNQIRNKLNQFLHVHPPFTFSQ
ncbi:hypothetical protein SDC9_175531 [bioreactor metagenome]|uniref:Uncharacterized protein n=1 Tax=bioreactor metagenome TaxID=1076179 RepID=A0A645GQ88_9ZZZZ